MTTTSAVILNFNGKEFLGKFLPAHQKYSKGIDVVVADNNSKDGSILFLQENYPNIYVIQLDKNYGYAEGYNQALKEIDSDYIILINSDVEVTDGWYLAPIKFLEDNKDYAACQPKILSYDNRNNFEYAGASGGFIDMLGYPYCRGRVFDQVEKDEGQYDSVIDIHWASGACLFIRNNLFKKMGGFDPVFFAHMEEIDLCWRLSNNKWKIACVPQSKVFHVGGGTLSKNNPKKTYLNFRNNLLAIFKNMPKHQLYVILMLRFVLDFFVVLRFLSQGLIRHCISVLKANRDFMFFKNLKTYRLTGKKTNPGEKLILIEYFLKKRRTFAEIHRSQ